MSSRTLSASAHATIMSPIAAASTLSWLRSRMLEKALCLSLGSDMAKPKKEDHPEIEEEPGAEERFERAVKRALSTPPKPFTPGAKKAPRKERKKK